MKKNIKGKNYKNQVTIEIIYESGSTEIFIYDINDRIEKMVNEFASKKHLSSKLLTFIYSGDVLSPSDFQKSFYQKMNILDKRDNKMVILVYKNDMISSNNDIPPDDINIYLIKDSREVIVIKAKKGEIMKNIIKRGLLNEDLNKYTFYYKKKEIDLNKRFDEIADEIYKKINILLINVYHKEQIIVNFIKDNSVDKRIPCFGENNIEEICIQYCKDKNLNFDDMNFEKGNNLININETISQLIDKNESEDNIFTNNNIINNENNSNLKEINIIVTKKKLFEVIQKFQIIQNIK